MQLVIAAYSLRLMGNQSASFCLGSLAVTTDRQKKQKKKKKEKKSFSLHANPEFEKFKTTTTTKKFKTSFPNLLQTVAAE